MRTSRRCSRRWPARLPLRARERCDGTDATLVLLRLWGAARHHPVRAQEAAGAAPAAPGAVRHGPRRRRLVPVPAVWCDGGVERAPADAAGGVAPSVRRTDVLLD